jgi:hypothetical protein
LSLSRLRNGRREGVEKEKNIELVELVSIGRSKTEGGCCENKKHWLKELAHQSGNGGREGVVKIKDEFD